MRRCVRRLSICWAEPAFGGERDPAGARRAVPEVKIARSDTCPRNRVLSTRAQHAAPLRLAERGDRYESLLEIRDLRGGQQQLAVIAPQVGDLIRIVIVHAGGAGLAEQVTVTGARQLLGVGVEVMGQ